MHNLLAHKQHPDMIGNIIRNSGVPKPKFPRFGEIQKGDHTVYYATKDCVVVGIFEVVSDIEYLPNDPYWKEMMIYRIKPVELPVPGNYLDFKKLVTAPGVRFDMIPKKRRWGNYLHGKTCLSLTNRDYKIINEAMSLREYLKSISEIDVEPTRLYKKHVLRKSFK